MKKTPIIFIVFALLISVFSLNACSLVPDYQIVVNPTDQVKITDKGFVVEAGNTFTIPQCEVYDKSGEYCEEFQVARVITDLEGNKKAGTLQMKHGEVYKVTYTATNGDVELTKEIALYCYDTVLPTMTLLNMQRMYNKGESITIKVNHISSDVDYENSTIVLKNENTGVTTSLSLTETYTFIADNEAELYRVIAELKDVNGNANTVEYSFAIAGNFVDTEIATNNIWDFDEEGYLNNIKVAGDSDSVQLDITSENVPEGFSGGVLKLQLKADERYVLTFINGQALTIKDCNTIGFNIWSPEVIDIFEVYNVDDNSIYDLSWKANKREVWQSVEFAPAGVFGSEYLLSSFKIVLSCEQDMTIYIDSIYYTDYVEPWRDEDLSENEFAVFDDDGYYERLSEQLIGDNTYGGSWEIVYDVPGTNDFQGGVLKFTSTTDANNVSGKFARDGFKFQLFDKLSYTDIIGKGFVFRMYLENSQTALSLDVYDQKLGKININWFLLTGVTDNWINIIVPYEAMAAKIEGCENITHLNLQIIRRIEHTEPEVDTHITYFDKISLYEVDFGKIDYVFTTDYDTRATQSIGGCVGMRANDEDANDNWALFGTTIYNSPVSGLQVNFNHLDISEYSSIYVRLKTTSNKAGYNSVDIYGNGVYLCYDDYAQYTNVDILPYMLLKGETHLDTITVGANCAAGVGIYIDEIIFVKKGDTPSSENTTPAINFTKAWAIKWGNYLLEDTDNGVKISGWAWEPAATYAFLTTVSTSEADTITVRFKQENAVAIMYFDSVYIEVGSGATKYAVSSEVDEQGFTILTLDVAKIIDANPNLTSLSEVKIGTSSNSGSAVFDYLTVNYK